MSAPSEISGRELIHHIGKAGVDVATFYVAQTGGGCATIEGGPMVMNEFDEPSFAILIGPGTYDWNCSGDSVFYNDELIVGPGWDQDEYRIFKTDQMVALGGYVAELIARAPEVVSAP